MAVPGKITPEVKKLESYISTDGSHFVASFVKVYSPAVDTRNDEFDTTWAEPSGGNEDIIYVPSDGQVVFPRSGNIQ